MSFAAKLRRAPVRAATGAFILNSGIGKLTADEVTAKQLHGMASGTYGFLGKVDPKLFAKGLAVGEIAVGGLLLTPIVSPVVAGGALLGFSGALLNLYWNTPGMHEEGSPRPTQQGVAVAKDVWMFGIGASLVADGVLAPAHDKHVVVAATVKERRHGKQTRKAKREARKARAEARAHVLGAARDVQTDLSKRARKAAKKAAKSDAVKTAQQASATAAKRLADLRDDYAPAVVDKVTTGAKQAKDAAAGLAAEYGPAVAERAKTARDSAVDLANEYGPAVAERARAARDSAVDLASGYGPVVADRAKAARDAATSYAADLVDEYRPQVVKQTRRARKAAEKQATIVRKAAEKQAKQTRKQLASIG